MITDAQLHRAANQNDAALVIWLLAEGAQVDARDGSGATALLVATQEQVRAELVRTVGAGSKKINSKK